ncbi:MAG: DUF1549 domain-containing protein [Planctomycetaceae bacterium]
MMLRMLHFISGKRPAPDARRLITKSAWAVLVALAGAAGNLKADDSATKPAEVLPSVAERFADAGTQETPDFQRHIGPLLGRLGCNGRSCHGSFQGRGGFQLSLFGYDFAADHKALTAGEKPRVNLAEPANSLIIRKPTLAEDHEGDKRFEVGSWQHHVLLRWIQSGAKYDTSNDKRIAKLEVTPSQLNMKAEGEKQKLKAVAVWPDGTREDVTPLCRFQTNDDAVAKIDEVGVVTATKPGDTHVVVFYDSAVVPVQVIRPVSDLANEKFPEVATPKKVDELVVGKLRQLGVVPSGVCNDYEFLRRVRLDLTGTLPLPAEVDAFIADNSPNKRAAKIDELLASPAYAAWWTTRLCDYTGNNDRQLNNVLGPMQGNAGSVWYDWIYKRVSENVSYDKLVEGIILSQSRKEGQSYTDYCKEMTGYCSTDYSAGMSERPTMPYFWARNNQRKSEDRAIGFAYSFMGIRIQCAQCHKHPFDQWSKQDFDDMKAFFSRVGVANSGAPDAKKEYEAIAEAFGGKKTNFNDGAFRKMVPEYIKEGKTLPFPEVFVMAPKKPAPPKNNKKNDGQKKNIPVPAESGRILGGETIDLTQFDDARKPLMDWLKSKENPYFAKAFVNRVWASYFNVGIVEPPDDLSLANPPSNAQLLEHLAKGFVENQFDMKWVHREILNSDTYQRSWQTTPTNHLDERNFSHAIPRRLPAEVAYDAMQVATASSEKAKAMLVGLEDRAIGNVSMPGRKGAKTNASFALQVFGRSQRESNCDCDRSMEASLLQTVYLQNDSQVLQVCNGGPNTWIDEVTRELRGIGTSSKVTPEEASEIKKDIAKIKTRIDRIQKKKEEEEESGQLTRLKERLAQLEAQVSSKPVPPPTKFTPEQSEKLIREAYLRTLSRLPSESEKKRCEEFLSEAATPMDGLKGLLWTLLNTKEFIVNH